MVKETNTFLSPLEMLEWKDFVLHVISHILFKCFVINHSGLEPSRTHYCTPEQNKWKGNLHRPFAQINKNMGV